MIFRDSETRYLDKTAKVVWKTSTSYLCNCTDSIYIETEVLVCSYLIMDILKYPHSIIGMYQS